MEYLVATMSDRQKTIAKLKGSLYSLSLDELVIRSIDEAQFEVSDMDCLYCDKQKTVIRNKLKTYKEVVNGKEVSIDVTRYPMNVCPSCNAEFDNMDVSLYLQKLIRYEILKALRSRKPIPEKFRFNEIVKM